jgi:hypothetical protein
MCADHDKKRYDSLNEAADAALMLLDRGRVLRPYACPSTGHFHLTSSGASADALSRLVAALKEAR